MTDAMTDLNELINRILTVMPEDHEPEGWPAVRMRELTALADEIQRLRTELAEYMVIEFEANSVRVPTFGKAWRIADDEDTQKVGDRLVELGLWERHPAREDHYRPIERTA